MVRNTSVRRRRPGPDREQVEDPPDQVDRHQVEEDPPQRVRAPEIHEQAGHEDDAEEEEAGPGTSEEDGHAVPGRLPLELADAVATHPVEHDLRGVVAEEPSHEPMAELVDEDRDERAADEEEDDRQVVLAPAQDGHHEPEERMDADGDAEEPESQVIGPSGAAKPSIRHPRTAGLRSNVVSRVDLGGLRKQGFHRRGTRGGRGPGPFATECVRVLRSSARGGSSQVVPEIVDHAGRPGRRAADWPSLVDRDGYAIVPDAIDARTVSELVASIDAIPPGDPGTRAGRERLRHAKRAQRGPLDPPPGRVGGAAGPGP